MKMVQPNKISRRSWLLAAQGLWAAQWFPACAVLGKFSGDSEFNKKINKKAHWAHRNNWKGQEYVFSVAGIGDRFLMVKLRSSGWDFPGGPVYPETHGDKSEENKDLLFAAASYFNSQALLSLRFEDALLFAYGYAINPVTHENSLVHWYSIGMPTSLPSDPFPNMNDSTAAKWTTEDDPVIGKCLQMRMNEYRQANEGGSILKQTCYEYSV